MPKRCMEIRPALDGPDRAADFCDPAHLGVGFPRAAKKEARPVGYVKRTNVQASWASRTMMLSGPIIAAFVVFHLLHLTTGTLHPQFVPLHAYENLVNGFLVLPIALYIHSRDDSDRHSISATVSGACSSPLASAIHGTRRLIKKFAAVFSWILIAGFISVPDRSPDRIWS